MLFRSGWARRACSSVRVANPNAAPLGSEAVLPSIADLPSVRSEEHTSELQSHRDLHSFPTRCSSDLAGRGALVRAYASRIQTRRRSAARRCFRPSQICLRSDRKSTRLNSSHTEIYTLSLHDALPIWLGEARLFERTRRESKRGAARQRGGASVHRRFAFG